MIASQAVQRALYALFSTGLDLAVLDDAGVPEGTPHPYATLGDVSDKCVKAVDQLSAAIVTYVRGGGAVPPPAPLP